MTNAPFLFLMAVLAGVCFYTGLNMLLRGLHWSAHRLSLSFAAMSLLVGVFFMAEIFGYSALSSDALVFWRRIDWTVAVLFFVAFTWFITVFTGWTQPRIPVTLSLIALVLISVNLFMPYGIGYPNMPILNRYVLPWGEVVTDIGIHAKTSWYFLSWIFILCIFVYAFAACRHLYRRGERGAARMLLYSVGVFLLFVLSNQLVNTRTVQFVYLAPFGFIAIIIMMGLYIDRENRRINQLLHASEGRYAAIISSSVDGIIITDDQLRIREFNAAAEHMFGYRVAEIIGKPIDCLFAEGPRWGYQQQLRNLSGDRTGYTAAQRFGRITGLRADRREFPVDASFSMVNLHGDQFISAVVRDASEYQKDKYAAKQSADRYRALVENLPGMAYRLTPAAPWQLQFVSDGVHVISGHPASYYYTAQPARWLDSIVPEDRQHVEDSLTQLVLQQTPVEFTYRIRHRDQSVRWVQDRAQLVRDSRGQPLWIDGLAMDITRQKQAEQALADTNVRLEAAVQARTTELNHTITRLNEAQRIASIGSWELEIVDSKLSWSEEMYRILELDPRQTKASYEVFLGMLHPDDRETVNHAYRVSVANHTIYDLNHRLLLPDGRIKYMQGRCITEYDAQGSPLRSLGTLQDVTARVGIERQLHIMDAAIANSLNGVAIADLQGNINYVNHAFLLMWGYSQVTEVMHRSSLELWQDPAQVQEVMQLLLTTGSSSGQLLAKRKDGSTFVAELYGVVLRNNVDEPEYLFGSFLDVTARVAAEQQLRRQAQVIDQIHDSVVATDLQGKVTSWNQGAVNLFGFSADEMLGQPISRVYPPDQQRILAEEIITLLQRNGQHEQEVIMLRRDGERFYAHLSVSMLYDEQGTAYGMIGYAIDISASKNFEQTLQQLNVELETRVRERTRELDETRQFNAAVVDTVGALVVVLERSGQIILFNHSCELTTGYSSAEVLGKCVWDFILPAEQRQPVRQVFAKLTAGDFPSEYENDWLHRGGMRRRIAWSNTCLVDKDGQVEFVIATGVDITERTRTEQALRSSEELFRQLAENIREVFFVRDIHENKMIYVSPAYDNLFNQMRENLYANSRAFVERVHPEDLPGVLAALQAQRDQQKYFNLEYRIVPRPGEIRWVWVRSFPVRDANGRVYRLAGLVEDITERRGLQEARLAHAREQRDLLVREVHHRIKNNLQGIVGLLRRHVIDQPELQPAVDSAITQVNAMALVHGLQGKNQVDGIRLCELTEAIAASIAGISGVAIKPVVERVTLRPVLLVADEAVPVALIINELLFNAVKHSRLGNQEQVHVHIQRHEQAIWLTMRSRGKSLPEDFNLAKGIGVGTGLQLVSALLPETCQLELYEDAGMTYTVLKLLPPTVAIVDVNT